MTQFFYIIAKTFLLPCWTDFQPFFLQILRIRAWIKKLKFKNFASLSSFDRLFRVGGRKAKSPIQLQLARDPFVVCCWFRWWFLNEWPKGREDGSKNSQIRLLCSSCKCVDGLQKMHTGLTREKLSQDLHRNTCLRQVHNAKESQSTGINFTKILNSS